MNKFEQVSSDGNQVSLAEGFGGNPKVPCLEGAGAGGGGGVGRVQ